ncbi:hypothetical protein [Tropicimonas isoalkanivorans]|uniref:Uncharacterized protein n=1 Tax=Tropicimonas isoalkanivorans TaxID=441112 RepID=A0A1I1FSP9_9RHOB|nr:hypothetical protein [Tropicimonas isoalkanivorans]SFC02467.1 hypothetical protein SAMN04488094_102273 [Tropicimonas isoalkanivorans]
MISEARLNAEVAELRRMLAESQAAKRAAAKPVPPHAAAASAPRRPITPKAGLPAVTELETVVDQMVGEVKGAYRRHPFAIALGAVAVGFLLGRRR